jgi:hypothetical protein
VGWGEGLIFSLTFFLFFSLAGAGGLITLGLGRGQG